VHSLEVGIRTSNVQPLTSEFDPVASRAREKAHRRAAARPRPRYGRLKYEHGEFVRQ
jgi:hypothetical protein